MQTKFLARLAACLLASWIGTAPAQTPTVSWAVSTYGPGGVESILGCGSCASDQRTMAVDAAGNIVVAGYTTISASSTDMMTVKFDGRTGAVLWSKTFDDAANSFDQAWALALDPSGNAIVTGYAWNGSEYDIKTIKYASADGAIAWQNTFTGPASGIDFGIAVATDAAGNVFVGGNVWNGTNDDFKVIKFAASDGATLWDKTFTGAGGFNDYAYALAVDGAGNVVATGEEQVSATDSDWKTIKFAAADGAILWQASLAGAAGGLDIPFSLRIDGANNVVVAGYVHENADADAKVVKYNGATGGVLWQKTFAGTGGGDDMFYSLALDGSGNVLVSGFTFNGIAGNDWNVAKYATADGAVLWQKTVNGSGNLSDVSVAIAVDAAGNAIAGGRINNSADPANRDMHAVKFAAGDGTVLWSYTYAGSGSGFDRVAAVATAPGAVFLAGESLETGNPAGWRIVRLDNALPRASVDFDGNGKSDLAWQHADGRAAIWLMNGAATADSGGILAAGSGWAIAQVADFDGDGKADLLWQHPDGRAAIWLMNGKLPASTRQILAAGGGWSAVHAADLNGDGKADIVWQNTNGSTAVWLMDGTTIAGGATILGAGTGWSVARTGDFDGDAKADLLWQHTDGRAAIWLMNGAAVKATAQILNAGGGWSASHVADLNGDGKADIVWRNTNGSVAAWLMNGTTMSAGTTLMGAATGWSVTRAGDFDGNGKADLFWQHTDGRAAIWLMNGLAASATQQLLGAGGGWSAARLADLNGDGKADIVWQNANGSVAVWLMNGTATLSGGTILGAGSGWSVSTVSQ